MTQLTLQKSIYTGFKQCLVLVLTCYMRHGEEGGPEQLHFTMRVLTVSCKTSRNPLKCTHPVLPLLFLWITLYVASHAGVTGSAVNARDTIRRVLPSDPQVCGLSSSSSWTLIEVVSNLVFCINHSIPNEQCWKKTHDHLHQLMHCLFQSSAPNTYFCEIKISDPDRSTGVTYDKTAFKIHIVNYREHWRK